MTRHRSLASRAGWILLAAAILMVGWVLLMAVSQESCASGVDACGARSLTDILEEIVVIGAALGAAAWAVWRAVRGRRAPHERHEGLDLITAPLSHTQPPVGM